MKLPETSRRAIVHQNQNQTLCHVPALALASQAVSSDGNVKLRHGDELLRCDALDRRGDDGSGMMSVLLTWSMESTTKPVTARMMMIAPAGETVGAGASDCKAARAPCVDTRSESYVGLTSFQTLPSGQVSVTLPSLPLAHTPTRSFGPPLERKSKWIKLIGVPSLGLVQKPVSDHHL